MAIYVVYSYQFSPIMNGQKSLFSDCCPAEQVWDNKQKIFGDLFDSELAFIYRTHRHGHEVLFNENGLIFLKLANNKQIVQESSFKTRTLEHNPSCNILIDNRQDIQNLYIEKSSYAFSDTSVTANILEKTFNRYLSEKGLSISITHRYKTQEFWDIIESAEKGVKMLRFSLQYPNLPDVRQKMGDMLADTSQKLKSKETKIEFNAGVGESLVISKDNDRVVEMVDASAASGKKITLRLNGIRAYREVGSTTEEVEIDNLEAKLDADLLESATQKIINVINKFKR